MTRLALAGAVFTALVSSAAIQGMLGLHEGEQVFFQTDFRVGAPGLTSGVTVDDKTHDLILAAGQPAPFGKSGTFVSLPAHSAKPFSGIFAAWRQKLPEGTGLDVAFRFAHSAEGPWSSWIPTAYETEFLLPDSFDYLQFRVRLTSDTGKATPRLGAISLCFGMLADDANVPPGRVVALPRPPVVTRAQWKARPPKEPYIPHSPNRLVVHHTFSPTQAGYQGAASIRAIQSYHMDSPDHNWIDIGYHFLIGPDGTIFEGRPENVVGSHVIPNGNKIGICMIGNFQPPSHELPTPIQKARLIELLSHLAGKYGISPEGIRGHRDYMDRECPGQSLYDELPELRSEVAKRLAAGPAL